MVTIGVMAIAACAPAAPSEHPSNPTMDNYASSLGIDVSQFEKRSDHILYHDVVVGTGAEAKPGNTVRVTYTGWLPDGEEFDSNVGDAPFQFALGAGQVVQGWDEGLVGMRAGGKRRLLVGSEAGYGREGNGPIPPNSSMVFEVEMLSVQ